ncbi:hypothetical protein BJX65DRAFT_267515 [Aspergillus insuetus]
MLPQVWLCGSGMVQWGSMIDQMSLVISQSLPLASIYHVLCDVGRLLLLLCVSIDGLAVVALCIYSSTRLSHS